MIIYLLSKEVQMSSHASNLGRTRNYATIVYEESAPENWKDILQEIFIPCFISPVGLISLSW